MTKKSDPKSKPSKTFDVSKPGKTPANATSRPIIVSHASMIKKDPMVRDSIDESEEKPEEVKPSTQTHQVKIEPLKKEDKSEEPEAKAPEERADEPKQDEAKPEDTEEKPEAVKSEGGAVEALAGEVTAKREEQKQREAAEAKSKELEKVIESKEFFVPIGQAARRRSAFRITMVILLLLLIIVGVFALNSATDTGTPLELEFK
jgi:hypothetical protein